VRDELQQLPGAGLVSGMNPGLRRSVLRAVRERFRLEWRGIHGVPHWARVRHSGRGAMKERVRVLGRATGRIVYCQGPCFATSAFTASTSSSSM